MVKDTEDTKGGNRGKPGCINMRGGGVTEALSFFTLSADALLVGIVMSSCHRFRFRYRYLSF